MDYIRLFLVFKLYFLHVISKKSHPSKGNDCLIEIL